MTNSFDWKRFCDDYGIPYVERGPNTARNHISIKCPFCGDNDPSEHMGLCLDRMRPAWGCLRSEAHRGLSPARLVKALLRCSAQVAQTVVAAFKGAQEGNLDDSLARIARPTAVATTNTKPRKASLSLPKEFKPIEGRFGYAPTFLRYLEHTRGLMPGEEVAKKYNLRYCLAGDFAWRVIIPFYDHGNLVGWTGRAIDPRQQIRYLTLSDQRQMLAPTIRYPLALVSLSSYIWQQDQVLEPKVAARTLVVCEGPFDAIKLDHYKLDAFTVITCTFGKPRREQIDLLGRAAQRYERVLVMMDRDAWSEADSVAYALTELSGKRAAVVRLQAKDPAEMTPAQIRAALRREQVFVA